MAVVSGPSVLWEMDGRGCILSIKFWPVGDGGSLKNLRLLVWFDGATDAQASLIMSLNLFCLHRVREAHNLLH